MASGNPIIHMINRVSLVKQIVIGLVLGIARGSHRKQVWPWGLLGSLFVVRLKPWHRCWCLCW